MESKSAAVMLVSMVGLCVVTPALAADGGARSIVKNPGFEDKLDSWSVHVYGAQPEIEADKDITHEGKQSVRISSTEPSDTALGQDVQLKPSQIYRFTGWVRTRGLHPRGASVFGTFQIQQAGGAGIIASGTNHGA